MLNSSDFIISRSDSLGEDYGLASICEGIPLVKTCQGNHQSFIAAASPAAASASGAAAVAKIIENFINHGSNEQWWWG